MKALKIAVFIFTLNVQAAGVIQIDTQGFLRSSNDRQNSISTLSVGPRYETEGQWIRAKLDLQAIAFLSDTSSFTLEATDAYVSTSKKLLNLHEITLGRRKFDWSTADDLWDLSLWNPSFVWNPFRYDQIGQTGLFYKFQSKKFKVLLFGSPLGIPERGFPVYEENGKLVSPSTSWIPPVQQFAFLNKQYDIQYNLIDPKISDAILRPTGGISFQYGDKGRGFWTSVSYGYMPMHRVDIAVKAGLSSQGVAAIDLLPVFPMHHLINFETGFVTSSWSIWGSLTGESPSRKAPPSGYISTPMGPALVTAGGGSVKWLDGLTIDLTYLYIYEQETPKPESIVDVAFPSRFFYKSAWAIQGRWEGPSPLAYQGRWLYDVTNASNLFSLDIEFNPSWKSPEANKGWKVGLGADILSTSTEKGYIGQYEGDDRIRGQIAYAF